jgi:ribosome biogenesis GTPase / thiamine phosphate phosphatase
MALQTYGWNEGWAQRFSAFESAFFEPARVVCELRRKFYAVETESGEVLGECVGKFHHGADQGSDYPAVGDWVAVRKRKGESRADIHALLPRTTKFSRRAAGDRDEEQVVAANVDLLLFVCALDHTFNARRIERFIVAVRESGARPAILLNKADLAGDAKALEREVRALAPGVPVLLTSAKTRLGLAALAGLASPGETVAFIGTSGAGKSSLVNRLLREQALPTTEVREKDAKGRHTTTRRELLRAPNGLLVIDTPGLRELKLWEVDEGLASTFPDIEALALRCRFGNCTHLGEPGCAVQAALASGTLEESRLASYLRLSQEAASRSEKWKRPSVMAHKPGWRRKAADPGRKPIRPQDDHE